MAQHDSMRVERRVGLLSAIALIAGSIIGSGIFVASGPLLERSNSVVTSLVVWSACGVLALFGALCYIELGVRVPRSGAEYSYLLEAFGAWPAFVLVVLRTLVLAPTALAAIALTFAAYALEPFSSGSEEEALVDARKLLAGAALSKIRR